MAPGTRAGVTSSLVSPGVPLSSVPGESLVVAGSVTGVSYAVFLASLVATGLIGRTVTVSVALTVLS